MKRSDLPSFLPGEVEEHLSHLLDVWASNNRLPAARARSIREALQEYDVWEQEFWTRVSPVLLHAAPVVQPVPARPWDLAIEADLTWLSALGGLDTPGFCPYLHLGR